MAPAAVGSFVILFDPIFQGLAIALMAGEVASTVLSRVAVPILITSCTTCRSETRCERFDSSVV